MVRQRLVFICLGNVPSGREIRLVSAIQPFSIDLWQHLASKVEITVVKKKVVLLKAGQIATRMFFVESGSVLCYRRVGDKKVVSGLREEGDFICIT